MMQGYIGSWMISIGRHLIQLFRNAIKASNPFQTLRARFCMNKKRFSKRVLLTGATGYIGSNLVSLLLAEDCDVHIIIRLGSNMDVLDSVRNSISVHIHDGSGQNMLDIVALAKPHVVFHLASLFLAQHQPSNIQDLIASNLVFSTQLVEAMVANNIKYLINTGTSWQHHQNSEYNPTNLYAATKQAFECILTYYIEACGLKVTTLALFDTYGPNDPRPKLVHLLWKTGLTQNTLEMSPGEQLIDLVHVDDVVTAFLKAANQIQEQNEGHVSYGISSGKPIPLKELVSIFEEVTGINLPIIWGGRPYRVREVMLTWSNFAKLPNWSPLISLRSGILSTRPRLSN